MLDVSVEELESAWERVRANDGCAGVDGVSVEDYERQALTGLPELRKQAQTGIYQPLPLRKIVILKKPHTSSLRTLLVPVVRDRILQTAVARMLSRSFEEEFFDVSYAYRPDRGVDRAVARIQQLRDRGFTWVVDADITGYFDHVSHAGLLKLLVEQQFPEQTMWLLRKWVKAELWDGHEVKAVKRGIPQGSPLSPILSNLFLTPFDEALEKGGNRLIRYADDFLILCQSEDGARGALADTSELLKASGLELNPDKTRIVTFEEGFKFLGVVFRGDEAMIPWKRKEHLGRVIFMARPMPARLLRPYRQMPPGEGLERSERKVGVARAVSPAPAMEEVQPRQVEEARLMAYLYVVEQGAVLRKSGDRFLVEHDQQIVLDVPYHRLENILVFGNIQITSQAMAEAMDKSIAVSFFSRMGRLRGLAQPAAGRNVELRIAQYDLYRDHARSLEWAKAVVGGKVRNGLSVLKRYAARRPEVAQPGVPVMERALTELAGAPGLDEVNGLEGAAAKAYFEELMRFNESPFPWVGRVKHPATDPLNALLSLTYTLIMHEITALLHAHGLDPALGFLHELDSDRPSLALDLMEAFRHPLADRLVMTALNRGMFTKEDFVTDREYGGVVLTPVASKRFFAEYERFLIAGSQGGGAGGGRPFRRRLQEEVEKVSKALREGEVLRPYVFEDGESGSPEPGDRSHELGSGSEKPEARS